ncbi:MAG: tRNA (adenosine(37)-N6)-dimethylallyltransferase MiaA [Gammaproteobacteria bacterium]|nr:MAG: tRNA (adenosine(37)-N6)-dimethylallyltransferase MiaA [Gammaproteobacteria bacterium]
MHQFNLFIILGPTASGKTRLAVNLAREFDGEILSADSRQVYRGLDIGSGKDIEEYEEIPYHLIDLVDPGYEYSVFDFQRDFYHAFDVVNKRNKMPILAGGSALYVDSILDGYRMLAVPENTELRKQLARLNQQQLTEHLLRLKPKQHNTTDLKDIKRLIRAIEIAEAEQAAESSLPSLAELNPLIIGIKRPRELTRKLITLRLKHRLDNGMIEEVQSLFDAGVSWQTLEFYGLEYRLIAQYLQKQLAFNDMYQKLNSAIHQFAKKQATWLRRVERKGHKIHWIDGEDDTLESTLKIIKANA